MTEAYQTHREIRPTGESDTVIKGGEWLYHTDHRPDVLDHVPEYLPDWLKLSFENAAWLAEELKGLAPVNECWVFVPDKPREDFRTDRVALVMPGSVMQLRHTRVGFGKNKRWEWEWHGPEPVETNHGVVDMAQREWWEIREEVHHVENGMGETEARTTATARNAKATLSVLDVEATA